MRLLFPLIAIGALSQGAHAAQPDCKTIADPASRLTCYDKINPPIATYPIPLPKPTYHPVPQPSVDDSGTVDSAEGNDAQMNQRMHGICRGC
jgi:hypothetical protein